MRTSMASAASTSRPASSAHSTARRRVAWSALTAAVAVLAALFNAVAPAHASTQPTPWGVVNANTPFTVLSTGTPRAASFSYSATTTGNNSWTFVTSSPTAGTLTLPYTWSGSHNGSGARLSFVRDSGPGVGFVAVNTPVNTATGQAFTHAGSATFTVNANQRYGFRLVVQTPAGSAPRAVSGRFTLSRTPTVVVPANIVAEASGAEGSVVNYATSASDPEDGVLTPSCTPASGSTFALGTTTVTCRATDSDDLTVEKAFTLTVRDTTGPVLMLPADITVEATGPDGAAVQYVAAASDAVSGSRPVSCSTVAGPFSPGDVLPLGSSVVTCSSVDGVGNSTTGSFLVTVVDTTGPVLMLPADVTVEATGPDGAAVQYVATASDAVSGSRPVSCSTVAGPFSPGDVLPLGSSVVTCSADDAAGNATSGSFVVTVVDTTAPVLTQVSDLTATATSSAGAAVSFSPPSAHDLVSGALATTCDRAAGSTFGLGTTQVTCSATDAAGNTGTTTFAITVTYAWSGVEQPINADGSSVFKQGSTVPVKFALTGASAGIDDAVVRLTVSKVTNAVVGTETEAVSTAAATTGNLFRATGSGSYAFNLSTKTLGTGTYQLRMDAGDGVVRTVQISLR